MQSKINGFLSGTAPVVRRTMIIGLVIIAGLFSSPSLFAQRQPMDTAAMRKRQEEMFQQMKTDLKLTDVQSDSVSSISKEFNGKRRDLFMDQSMSREDKRAKMEPLNAERDNRLKAALGSDLFKKYQDWMQAHRPQRGERGGGGGGGMQS